MDELCKMLSVVFGVLLISGWVISKADVIGKSVETPSSVVERTAEIEGNDSALNTKPPSAPARMPRDKVKAYLGGVKLSPQQEALLRQHFDKVEALNISNRHRSLEIELWFPEGIEHVPFLAIIPPLVAEDVFRVDVVTFLSRLQINITNRETGAEEFLVFTIEKGKAIPQHLASLDNLSEMKGVELNNFLRLLAADKPAVVTYE